MILKKKSPVRDYSLFVCIVASLYLFCILLMSIKAFFPRKIELNIGFGSRSVPVKIESYEQFFQYSEPIDLFYGDLAVLHEEKFEQNGNDNICVILGDLYLENAFFYNIAKSIEWYKKAMERGNSDGLLGIGKIYDKSNSLELLYHEDNREALRWYITAAEQGNTKAMIAIGDLHLEDPGVIDKWYRKGLELHKHTQYNEKFCSKLFFSNNTKLSKLAKVEVGKIALRWYQKAFELGDVSAFCKIGNLYLNNYISGKNHNDAIDMYKRAILKGCSDGFVCLGDLHLNHSDYGIHDKEKAVYYYEKGAAAKNLRAASKLAWFYKNKEARTFEDIRKYWYWVKKAAWWGDGPSSREVALKGVGTLFLYNIPNSIAAKRTLLEKAVCDGDREAIIHLLKIYQEEKPSAHCKDRIHQLQSYLKSTK